MTIMELGALGEFVGSFAVVVTLIYLSVQVRQNTKLMDANHRLALAQTYQMRADSLQSMLTYAADSEHVGPIIVKLTQLGYPEDIGALDGLTDAERGRFRLWQIAQLAHWDNMFFQHQQGFLDDEYFEDAAKKRLVRLAPIWRALGLAEGRRSFFDEIEKVEREMSS